MLSRCLTRGLAPLLLAGFVAYPAAATILDFEALSHDSADAITLGVVEEDGFRLTSNIDPIFADEAFGVWGSASENFNGSTALFNAYPGFVTTLQTVSGAAFTIRAIDVGPLAPDIAGQITFLGRRTDDTEVSATFAFGPGLAPPAAITFGDGFTNLASLSWEQETVQAHQFDNLDVVATPVPEPRTTLLVAAGFVVLLWGAARQRRQVRNRIDGHARRRN